MAENLPDTNVGNIEYIKKQAAIDAIREAENHAFNSFYKGLVKAHKIVVGLPPADVVPVVHAHWIVHESADTFEGYEVPMFECSKCRAWKEDDSDFCPDCGADMRGEQDDSV